ncbi:LLM class flavin-dependent oxidoreductase [Paracoccus aminophilus]|uniref:Monooxygenase n=1 Tax=Paracoccus aminophilus JCM 7686 TaxID=1367847 RepID=S5XTL8_PARAH|nr:LLM class flavin-dependent oxidoreductase [Paracoccus aminophilus]AGT10859.1 monooxygenase [Paracoccus aminophilus JCM 7686]
MSKKQVILGAQFPGVNNFTVWSHPQAGSQIAIESFLHFAKTLERGKFDFMFLAEGLRLREQKGRIYENDVAGRPNTLAILAALAGVTEGLGFINTLSSTFNEPAILARELASFDYLSGGRVGWNVVTSPNDFTGANFRRGGFLPYADRYDRARGFVEAARELWASPGQDYDLGPYGRGHFGLPKDHDYRPVIAQAGDSDAGRDFAASHADVIYSRHGTLAEGQAFYRDVKARVLKNGREAGALKILPGANVILGGTEDEARYNLRQIRLAQVSPRAAIALLEQTWNRDLSAYDAEGPLPEIEPDFEGDKLSQGRTRQHDDARETVRQWRALAEAEGLSIRELVIRVTARQHFVGTPESVAREINDYVQKDASDGFVFAPHYTPGGFDDFVDQVIPILQDWGVFRRDYAEPTLRGNLGLRDPLPLVA